MPADSSSKAKVKTTAGTTNYRPRRGFVGKSKKTSGTSKSRAPVTFSGGITELKNHFYDCSSYDQTDRFVRTTKAVWEHVGRTYKYGGDIRATIEFGSKYRIPKP